MSKSLTESAAEILKASLGAAKEPMSVAPEKAEELGGETPTTEPTAIGAAASAKAKEAPKPGTSGAPAEPMKKLADAETKTAVDAMGNVHVEEAEVSAEDEEVELTEEEIEEYLNSLTEEELAALAAEVDAEELDEQGMTGLKKMKLQPWVNGKKPKMAEEAEDSAEVIEEEPELTPEQVEEARKEAVKELVAKNMASCKEDVDALFNGEALSEEFRTKATTIFEAAVRARVEAIAMQVVSENETLIESTVAEIQEELTNQVDEYLNYVVENWMEENQLAVETGLRAEIAEDFMNGLKNLFAEHYIEVPEDKADLVEEMAKQVADAETKLEEQANALTAVTKALNESKSKEVLRKICEGLTEVQVQKIKALAEGVEFTTEGDYTEKLSVIRENYFPSSKPQAAAAPQVVVETEEEKEDSGIMNHYVKAITKQLPK